MNRVKEFKNMRTLSTDPDIMSKKDENIDNKDLTTIISVPSEPLPNELLDSTPGSFIRFDTDDMNSEEACTPSLLEAYNNISESLLYTSKGSWAKQGNIIKPPGARATFLYEDPNEHAYFDNPICFNEQLLFITNKHINHLRTMDKQHLSNILKKDAAGHPQIKYLSRQDVNGLLALDSLILKKYIRSSLIDSKVGLESNQSYETGNLDNKDKSVGEIRITPKTYCYNTYLTDNFSLEDFIVLYKQDLEQALENSNFLIERVGPELYFNFDDHNRCYWTLYSRYGSAPSNFIINKES